VMEQQQLPSYYTTDDSAEHNLLIHVNTSPCYSHACCTCETSLQTNGSSASPQASMVSRPTTTLRGGRATGVEATAPLEAAAARAVFRLRGTGKRMTRLRWRFIAARVSLLGMVDALLDTAALSLPNPIATACSIAAWGRDAVERLCTCVGVEWPNLRKREAAVCS